jgi:signal transduction histidine kinase
MMKSAQCSYAAADGRGLAGVSSEALSRAGRTAEQGIFGTPAASSDIPHSPEGARERGSTEPFDIVVMLHEMMETACTLSGRKPVAVMGPSDSRPVVVHSDPSAIRRIMTGLLYNAVKLTDRGRISLIVSIDERELKLTVADTGRGMSGAQIRAVLEPAGLEPDEEVKGLATSARGLRGIAALARKLDGALSIASKTGAGTIATVSLPLKASA